MIQENNFKLCYVDKNFAYFTTQELADQWGDDWNDAPYEHNAGEPYTWHESSLEDKYEVIKIAFDGDFNTPNYGHLNSSYSVQSINAGQVAWLYNSYKNIAIPAGATISQFIEKIEAGEGNVYLPKEFYYKYFKECLTTEIVKPEQSLRLFKTLMM